MMGNIEKRRLWFSGFIVVALLASFWGFSRYPDLVEEYLRADHGTLIEREMGSLSKDAMMSAEADTTNVRQIFVNTANWLYENRQGMSFGILFGGAILLLGQSLTARGRSMNVSGKRGVLRGILFGAPLGVCTNCAAPIGVAMHRTGATAETVFATVISSPMLNPIGLAALFLLFPWSMVTIRLLAVGVLLFLLLPFITNRYRASLKTSGNNGLQTRCDGAVTTTSETILSTAKYCLTQWLKNIGILTLWVVPIMVTVAFVMSAFTAYVPFEFFALVDTYRWEWVVVAATIGVLAPVPMFFDLVVVYLLLAFGVSDAVALTLLITLPAVSLFNGIVLGKYVSWKMSGALIVAVFGLGVVSGLMVLNLPQFDKTALFSQEKTVVRQEAGYQMIPFAKRPHTLPTMGFERIALTTVSDAYIRKLSFNPMIDFSYFLTKSAGVSWSDFNNDGWIDLFAVHENQPKLYQNDGRGHLIDVTKKMLPTMTKIVGGVWGDYDNDGDVDLIITRFANFDKGTRFKPEPLSNILLKNTGSRFVDVSQQAGITQTGFSQGAAWGDMDGDGDLDLYIANYGLVKMGGLDTLDKIPEKFPLTPESRSRNVAVATDLLRRHPIWTAYAQKDFLYRNNGDGTFTNVIEAAGFKGGLNRWADFQLNDTQNGLTLLHPTPGETFGGFSFQPVWFDVDNDGDLDLFLGTDFHRSELYLNRGDGTFDRETENMLTKNEPSDTMGVTVFDMDNDGYFDVYESTSGRNFLWHNQDGLYFKELASTARVSEILKIGWGVTAQDFDNDGVNELVVANGGFGAFNFLSQNKQGMWKTKIQTQNSFYIKTPQGYQNRSQQLKFSEVKLARGLAAADVNNDGLMDMVLNNIDEGIILYQNQSGAGNAVEIQLKDKHNNRFAIGAKISLLANDQWQHQLITAGNSFISQDTPWLHFGVGNAKKIDELIVQWPDGHEQHLKDLAVNHKIIITHP